MSRHPSDDDLERFLAARLPPAEQQRVVRHIQAGCSTCSRKLVEQAPDSLLQRAADSRRRSAAQGFLRHLGLADALRQDARRRMEEKKLARSLELLAAEPQGYDGLTFRQVQALHGTTLVEALLQRGFELRYRDPKAMRWLTYNGLKAAESLGPRDGVTLRLRDLQARAWAELANAYRINDEYPAAEEAFQRARSLMHKGSGDLQLLAHVAQLQASFRVHQRRLKEARKLFDGAYRLYLKLENRRAAGQILVSMAISSRYGDKPSQALQLTQESFSLLDPDRDFQLIAIARQNLVNTLADCDRFQEAGRVLLKSDLRHNFANDPIVLLKIRGVEGRIQAGLGRSSRAEKIFSEVRTEFLDMGQKSEAASVGLELLSILAQQGKRKGVREIARETYGIFQDLGIYQEAVKARRYLE